MKQQLVSIALDLMPIISAAAACAITRQYKLALPLAAFLYVSGRLALDMAGLNPDGIVPGNVVAFEGSWWGGLLGALLAVSLWTAALVWLVRFASRSGDEGLEHPSMLHNRAFPDHAGQGALSNVKASRRPFSTRANAKYITATALFGLGITAGTIWIFTPNSKDRWVQLDGSVACADEEDLKTIQKSSDRSVAVEIETTDKRCVGMLREDRVRLLLLSNDQTRALCLIKSDNSLRWIEVSALAGSGKVLLALPWRDHIDVEELKRNLTARAEAEYEERFKEYLKNRPTAAPGAFPDL